MTIQPTTSGDITALAALLDTIELFPSGMLADMLAPALAGDSEAIWLTHITDKKPDGFLYALPEDLTDGTWNMLAIGVHADMQGSGIGSALTADLERRLRGAEARILIVDTSGTEGFAATRRFYAKHGYDQEAVIRDFWAAGDDKVTFRKAL